MSVLRPMAAWLQGLLASHAVLVAENLALRQQLAVLQRSPERPRRKRCDRLFWVWFSEVWKDHGEEVPRQRGHRPQGQVWRRRES